MTISIAVVPTDGSTGVSPFARYMADNWRNAFDVAALDSIGDFISLMTYAQHGAATAPGPIAGLEWTRRMQAYALAEGVEPERISLGMPFYSGYWAANHTEKTGPRPVGREVPYRRVSELLLEGGASAAWLPEVGASLAFWEQEGTYHWLFIEDRQALRAKLDVFDRTLMGVSIWVMGAEAPGVWDELRGWKR
jgi:spore germination protein YaaH